MLIFDSAFHWGESKKPGLESWFDIRVFYNNGVFYAVGQNPPSFEKSPFPENTGKWASLIFMSLKEGLIEMPKGSNLNPENFVWIESRPNYELENFKEKFEQVELHCKGMDFSTGGRKKLSQEVVEQFVGEDLETVMDPKLKEKSKELARRIYERFIKGSKEKEG